MPISNDLFGGEPTKRCPCCGKDKELWQYYNSKSSADGHQSYCKECQKAYKHRHPVKEWKRRKNQDNVLPIWTE